MESVLRQEVNYSRLVVSAADREVQRILLELLNQMDGFDQNVNVKVSPPASLGSAPVGSDSDPLALSLMLSFSSRFNGLPASEQLLKQPSFRETKCFHHSSDLFLFLDSSLLFSAS